MNVTDSPLRKRPKSIKAVLDALDNIIDKTREENNCHCAFTHVYRRTTFEIQKAINDGRFEHPERMVKMDVIFANLYIDAYHSYVNTVPTSKSWTLAFNSRSERIAIIQHILLGMNVHINMDLAVAAATVCRGKDILDLKHDFMLINQILAELVDNVQGGLGKSSLMMRMIDLIGMKKDEWAIGAGIKMARDFAWTHAMELAIMDQNIWDTRILEIDEMVYAMGEKIRKPPSRFLRLMLMWIRIFEKKDAQNIIKTMNFR